MSQPSWGNFFGRIAQFFPSRKESLINEINKTKKELMDVQSQQNTPITLGRYAQLSDKLMQLEEKLKSIDA